MIDTKKLDFWIKGNLNVLMIADHGVGKTACVTEAFTRHFGQMGEKWLYFSAATMDPWVDFIGVPREVKDDKGEPYLQLVRPRVLRDDKIEAIFIDEFNRAAPKIRNAIMELIQFKSINGYRFKNLKIIWGAVNPFDDNGTYDVEKIDPAQLDRFHIHYEIPFECDQRYFTNKYGAEMTDVAISWWKKIPQDIRKTVSPRRLDYALQIFTMGGSIRNEVIPPKAHVASLLEGLGGLNRLVDLQNMLKEDPINISGVKSFLEKDANYAACEKWIIDNPEKALTYLENEKISSLMTRSTKVEKYVMANIAQFGDIVAEKQQINQTQKFDQDEKLKKFFTTPGLSYSNYKEKARNILGYNFRYRRTNDEVRRGISPEESFNERIKSYSK